ncbi:MAG: 23S rRNA (adenine(2503)-C(2))-methyltransferase [Chloroflexi bacterium RBG_16_63_12]|nr:MAG: 23S rRNA (adenine(2503)-C(2))-methyltransferase [Chloroflexi bacterium RBG_16_63_12]
MQSLLDISLEHLTQRLETWGEPQFRAQQIWQAIYHDLATSPDEITTLPKVLREKLKAEFTLGSLSPAAEARSSDGQTRKRLFRLPDGKSIEAVLMGYEKRRTTCISTQAGCAMGCVFCATGQMGFRRHLRAGEIVEQVLWFARELKANGDRLTNIVVMGMGEPFHNYEATMAAVDLLNDPAGFNFGARRITLSTVGLAPMIERFAAERRQVNLAVSLHAATDELRSELLPINKKYPLDVLFEAVRKYYALTKRRVTFEWALIQGKNDTAAQARALADLAVGLPCHVNVIPLNPTRDYAGQATTRERAAAFKAALESCGLPCTIRVRRGIDINAGCGQLAVEEQTVPRP